MSLEANEKEFPLGWLSPEGKLYPCGYMEHLGYADTLREELYPGVDSNEHPDDFLLNRGWVELTRFTFFGHKYMVIFMWDDFDTGKLTPEQHHYLKPFVEDNWDEIDETCKFDLAEEFGLEFHRQRGEENNG